MHAQESTGRLGACRCRRENCLGEHFGPVGVSTFITCLSAPLPQGDILRPISLSRVCDSRFTVTSPLAMALTATALANTGLKPASPPDYSTGYSRPYQDGPSEPNLGRYPKTSPSQAKEQSEPAAPHNLPGYTRFPTKGSTTPPAPRSDRTGSTDSHDAANLSSAPLMP